ncbi:hypothetical protein GCM10010218_42490 [Streptomyces mashuensis]|uniref:EF-hand domain-containing protein n=1 Tax=Streptomyces mashuensis TaxID=33904 RepID=A0A919EDJ4_9ACTN|nr:EF-hand domain-containing protein [Streptomyces mashuensis]GHF56652.1 hypothetical protein GCM10010218_42490 [Streptomyces mashuensis]
MNRGTAEAATVARERVFAMMDRDGDHVVTRHDYLSRIDRTVLATGRTEDDPLVIAARTEGVRAWSAMDANGDGKLTFDEYNAWVGADKFDHVCQFALGALFDLADADGDGAVDKTEFTTLRTALNNAPDNAAAAFDALDTAGKGLVGRETYLASIRAYIVGESSPMGEVLY